jgi:hypothetical protein
MLSNYSLVASYLKNAPLFVLKRLEIVSYLEPLNNETYTLFNNSFQEFQTLSEQAKKLRITLKNAQTSRDFSMTKKEKESAMAIVNDINKYASLLIKDLMVTRSQMLITEQQIKEELKRRNLQNLITLDLEPIGVLIKEIQGIIVSQNDVRTILATEIEVAGKIEEVEPVKKKRGGRPPMVKKILSREA